MLVAKTHMHKCLILSLSTFFQSWDIFCDIFIFIVELNTEVFLQASCFLCVVNTKNHNYRILSVMQSICMCDASN